MKLPKQLTPIRLRIVLIAAIALIVLAQIGAIVLGQTLLKQSSSDVTAAVAQSDASKHTLDSLANAERVLEREKTIVEKSKKIAADGNNYAYQTQIIDDLSAYAKQTGIKITSFTFSDPSATQGAASTPATASDKAAAAKKVAGLTPVAVSVQLVPTIKYNAFLQFLRLIENNLTHMQVQGVQISKGDTSTPEQTVGPDTVNVSSISLEVYTKK